MTRYWGPCTWYLFHTLAEKVKDEQFLKLKNGFISIIKRICSNLPCPECAEHAQHKLKSLNMFLISLENLNGSVRLEWVLLT